MKIGLYSITYRGVWYRGDAVDIFSLIRLAKQQGWRAWNWMRSVRMPPRWTYRQTIASGFVIWLANSESSCVPCRRTVIFPVQFRFSGKP